MAGKVWNTSHFVVQKCIYSKNLYKEGGEEKKSLEAKKEDLLLSTKNSKINS